jgi:hypothetical protein
MTIRTFIEIRAAQRARRLGQTLEQRLQFGQSSVLGVCDGGPQPGFKGHDV